MRYPLIAAALATVLLAGCATSPTGRSQLMLVPDSQMSQMGISAFNAMGKQGKFANAPREKAYATCVADDLIAVLPLPWRANQWDVEIIDDASANAFALPGGRIGVNKGMFKVATDQNLLAVVLGHELSHVVSRHGAERLSDQYATQAAVAAGSAYAGSRGTNAGYVAAALGLGAQVGILLPFSRTQESEADTLGQRYMAEAGFDPRAAPALWQKMESGGGSKPPAFLSTHPSSAARQRNLAEQGQRLVPVYEQARASGHKPHCSLR